MSIIWSNVIRKPCIDCHLRPCYREEECPKIWKWKRKLEAAKAQEQKEKEMDQAIKVIKHNGNQQRRKEKRNEKKQ